MNKSEILKELKKQKPVLKERFNVTKIALIESNSVQFCDNHIIPFQLDSGVKELAGV